MKVLVIGNSQSAALKRAHEPRAENLRAKGFDCHFYVILGGSGPDFLIEDDRLVPGKIVKTHPPFMSPAGTNEIPLKEFDALLISALGYFDGGFRHKNLITRAGVLADCRPRGEALKRPPVSHPCMAEIMAAALERQNGIRTLRRICETYVGPVFVQRWPHLSEAILDHQDWGLRLWYEAPAKAYRILAELRDSAMEEIANDIGARLLDYPDFDHPRGFSPRGMMRDSDYLHQSDAYADLIIDQLCERLGIVT
ncbi:hypothetical protein [Nioella sp.]|uniref:hypothetical protein n=1 Tax=Nioella sp. TaxID=1912091 RepID=UPI003A8BAFB9